MELKINTMILKTMLAKAVKGASNDKMYPLTSLIGIKLEDGTLTLTTTDYTNYLYVKAHKISGDDFYVVIEVEQFSKLIARTTTENVTLTLKENSLEVKGNGTYQIELPLDEEGERIKYPDPVADFDEDSAEETEIHASTVRAVLDTIKSSLAVTDEMPWYNAYYMGDKIVGTDEHKMASMNVEVFDEPKLISVEMMDLLNVFTAEKIGVLIKDDVLVFKSDDVVLYGNVKENIEQFPINELSELMEADFASSCKIRKDALLQVLDRVALFVDAQDNDCVTLTFTKEGLQVSSKSSSGVEILSYDESKKFKSFTCSLDVIMLITQIKAYADDVVNIQYGGKKPALKFVNGNITQMLAFADDE